VGAPLDSRPLTRFAALAALAVAASGAGAASLPALPLYGGDVRALEFDPRHADRVFAGTAAGQLYRSDDGGHSWREAGVTVPFPNWVVGALHFDRNRPARLWAGVRGLWGGGGVAFSDDLGATWTWSTGAGFAGRPVHQIVTVPGVAGRLYAAARDGVWRSDDDGAAWRQLSQDVVGLTQVASLAIDPRDPKRLLAGTWRRAFRSDDGGASWRGVFDGMVLDTEVFQLLAPAATGDVVWAATCGWIYRGEGFGERWQRVQSGLAERRTRALLRVSADRLVAGTVAGAFVSDDGGASFRRADDPGLSIVALAHHPTRPEQVLAATDGAGVWRSDDGGASFAPSSHGLAALRVTAVAGGDEALYVAVPWAGPLSGVYRAIEGGARFERLEPPLAAPVALAIADGELFALADGRLLARAADGWRAIAGDGAAEAADLRPTPDGFALDLGGRRFVWRRGRLEPAAETSESGASAPWRRGSGALPPGSVLAEIRLGGRLLFATAGFGLRWAEPAPAGAASVGFEAGENAQVGGEPLGRDR